MLVIYMCSCFLLDSAQETSSFCQLLRRDELGDLRLLADISQSTPQDVSAETLAISLQAAGKPALQSHSAYLGVLR